MWNLEQTEQFVLRVRPIIVIGVLLVLLWLTLIANPRQLSEGFSQTTPAALVQK